MILDLALAAQLAAACAPGVAVETLAAVMQTESGFDPLAIHVNGEDGGRRRAGTRKAAVALATELIAAGRSVDLGLMQVNSGNLPRLGLTVAAAFDPCSNLAAGARILREGYAAGVQAGPDRPHALGVALSRYNTGHPERGFANGYVARVRNAAEIVVPAIRLRGAAAPTRALGAAASEADDPEAPPEWDVWARATYVRPPRLSNSAPAAPADGGAANAAVAPSPASSAAHSTED